MFKNNAYNVNIIFFIEGIVFYLLMIFVSGNWLIPFIILVFKKLRAINKMVVVSSSTLVALFYGRWVCGAGEGG
jgi:ABC-type antimicrobial peptide transport system permease subunit